MEHAFYALSHDEIHHSSQILRNHQWSKMTCNIWRQPTAFGPIPGLDFSKGYTKTVTATIDFKTSGTLLRNFLPNGAYKFTSKDTVVWASLTVQSRENIEWLGGHGFERVFFEIHGIEYSKPNASNISGIYLPLVIDNSADALCVSREELGYPSVFSEIHIDRSGRKKFSAVISWKGSRWAKIWFDNLLPLPNLNDASNYLQRYSSEIIQRDSHNEDHRILRDAMLVEKIPVKDGAQMRNGLASNGAQMANGELAIGNLLSFQVASEAGFEFTPHSEQELPTVHHIASRLADVPIFELVSATIAETQGPETVIRASRYQVK
jgi:hypothetical protein